MAFEISLSIRYPKRLRYHEASFRVSQACIWVHIEESFFLHPTPLRWRCLRALPRTPRFASGAEGEMREVPYSKNSIL